VVQGKSMIRVAFWFDAPVAYSGGLNYIANLLHALSAVNSGDIQPYVFFATDVPYDVIQRFERFATIVRTPILQRKTLPWLVHKLTYKVFGSMLWVNALLKRHRIDLLSHAWSPYLGHRPLKVISWIPDFQYLHLPEMFPGLDVEKESQINRQIALHADAVVVSSEHALGDLLSLLPRAKLPPVEVLRFVSQPFIAPDNVLPSLEQLEVKYGFTGKFFLLPNQFWAHKNHEVVLRALALAKDSGLSMTVLMTGNTKDYRLAGSPYVDGLQTSIRDLGIDAETRILGLIDYNDLLALMRHCVGLINPSRFEGWSSSVEEAKSVGKTILMSNIRVHIEQAPPLGAYFESDDEIGLSHLMRSLWEEHESVDQAKREREAREDLDRRTKAFGKQYLNLIKRVLEGTL
jgi:glycosyltransferase involved in cell wall biosynthesis